MVSYGHIVIWLCKHLLLTCMPAYIFKKCVCLKIYINNKTKLTKINFYKYITATWNTVLSTDHDEMSAPQKAALVEVKESTIEMSGDHYPPPPPPMPLDESTRKDMRWAAGKLGSRSAVMLIYKRIGWHIKMFYIKQNILMSYFY